MHIIHVYNLLFQADHDGDILGPKISKFVDQNSLFRAKIGSKNIFFSKNFKISPKPFSMVGIPMVGLKMLEDVLVPFWGVIDRKV